MFIYIQISVSVVSFFSKCQTNSKFHVILQSQTIPVLQRSSAGAGRIKGENSCFQPDKHSLHPLTSGRIQIPAGSHLRRRQAEQHAPARPIPSQTKSGAPRSAHVERRSQTVLNQPTQNRIASALPETCRSSPGSDSGHLLVAGCACQDTLASSRHCAALPCA